jgi:hypothetical protein
MNPQKVERSKAPKQVNLPNIGPSMAKDLEAIGINTAHELIGKAPLKLYKTLCAESRT